MLWKEYILYFHGALAFINCWSAWHDCSYIISPPFNYECWTTTKHGSSIKCSCVWFDNLLRADPLPSYLIICFIISPRFLFLWASESCSKNAYKGSSSPKSIGERENYTLVWTISSNRLTTMGLLLYQSWLVLFLVTGCKWRGYLEAHNIFYCICVPRLPSSIDITSLFSNYVFLGKRIRG